MGRPSSEMVAHLSGGLTRGLGARDGWWYPRTVGMLVGCAVGSGAVRVKAPGGMVTGYVTVAVTAAANKPLCKETACEM